jgi:hypothetical protein
MPDQALGEMPEPVVAGRADRRHAGVRGDPGRPWPKSIPGLCPLENLRFSRELRSRHLIREVQQAVFPQPARARREGEIQFRIDLAFVLREDLQLCEEALTAPSPDCGDPRSARGRRNFSPPSPARSRRALRHYGHTAGPRPPPDDSRSCRRAPRSSRAHHASRESRAAGPAPLSRSRRR